MLVLLSVIIGGADIKNKWHHIKIIPDLLTFCIVSFGATQRSKYHRHTKVCVHLPFVERTV